MGRSERVSRPGKHALLDSILDLAPASDSRQRVLCHRIHNAGSQEIQSASLPTKSTRDDISHGVHG